jgi:hypothetical protein
MTASHGRKFLTRAKSAGSDAEDRDAQGWLMPLSNTLFTERLRTDVRSSERV